MGEFVVSEKIFEYKSNQSADDLLLKIFKNTYKDGIIVIDNEDNIIHINDIAKKLLGPIMDCSENKKIDIPYSISKERTIHVKVNHNTYRTISINASKFTQKRKKYHLLTIKKVNYIKEDPKKRPSLIENTKNFLHYIYGFKTNKFTFINENLKFLLDLTDNQIDLRSSIVEKINYSDQHYFVDAVNEVEQSKLDDEERYFEITYRYNYNDINRFVVDYIKITKSDGVLFQLESNALIINESANFVNKFSENDGILKIIGNNLSMGFFKIDLINKSFEVSDNFYRHLGYSKEELIPLYENYKALIHPDDVEGTRVNYESYISNREKSYSREYRIKQKNGVYKWVKSRGTTYKFDEIGQPSQIIGFIFDKSDDKDIFIQKELYQTLFDALLNNTNDIIFITDQKGRLLFLSQNIEKLTGIKNKEFINKPIWETLRMTMLKEDLDNLNYEYHKSIVLDMLLRTIQNGISGPIETKHINRSGNLFILESVFYPIIFSDKSDPIIMAISKDITGLNILQNEIKEKAVIYNELIDNSTDAIVVFKPENEKIIYANNVAAKLYGLPKEELMEKSILDFSLNPEFGSQKVQETINKRGIVQFKTKQKNINGKSFELLITGSYINYKNQNVILSINKFIKYIK